MANGKGNILLVDDNEVNIQVLASILQSVQHHIEFATSGAEALEWCSGERFDLVLLDIMMPGMDGYEVCRRLKTDEKTADIPIIFITAKEDANSIDDAFETGAVDYITKPFRAKELLSRVSVHVGLHQSQKQIHDLYEELKIKNHHIEESFVSGSMLQKAVLPTEIEMFHLFPEHYILYRPYAGVGGDFYWAHRISEHITAFAVGDCTGHGVPGALMSMFGIAQLHAIISEMDRVLPSEILHELRSRIVVQLHQSDENLSNSINLALMVIDRRTRTLTFSTADMPFIILSSNDLSQVVGASVKLRTITNKNRADNLYYIDQITSTAGYDLFQTEYYDTCIEYNPGDSVVLFSDGFKDQFGGPNNQKFSKQRFIEVINNVSILPMEMQGYLLNREFDEWVGDDNEQIDDMTVVGIELE